MSLLQRRCISRNHLHVSIMYTHLMSFSGCSELMDSCQFCVCARARGSTYVNIVVLEGGGENESLCKNVI